MASLDTLSTNSIADETPLRRPTSWQISGQLQQWTLILRHCFIDVVT